MIELSLLLSRQFPFIVVVVVNVQVILFTPFHSIALTNSLTVFAKNAREREREREGGGGLKCDKQIICEKFFLGHKRDN